MRIYRDTVQAVELLNVQVLEDAPASPTVIVADCPTQQHLPSLLAAPAWVPFTHTEPSSSLPQHANCIVHLAPAEVSLCGATPARALF